MKVLVQDDGKVVLAGSSTASGYLVMAVARLDASGNRDTTFDGDGRTTVDICPSHDILVGAAIQPGDGKIVLSGTSGYGAGGDPTRDTSAVASRAAVRWTARLAATAR